MLRATPGVTVARRGGKITWPRLSGCRNFVVLGATHVRPALTLEPGDNLVGIGLGGWHRPSLMRQYRRTHRRHSRRERVSAGQGRSGLMLHALQDLFASGWGDTGLATAIFTGLLPERQTGVDPACCAACWAVGQRGGFRCHRGAVEEKCAPTATFAAATPGASPFRLGGGPNEGGTNPDLRRRDARHETLATLYGREAHAGVAYY